MDSIIFIRKYETYLDEIQQVVKPEYQPLIDELKETDPHDLVTPDTWFSDETSTRGLVWKLFLLKVKESERILGLCPPDD
ncbi:hypothetical protein [Mariniphaga sp.]|uniref:hypothetical protein n=1 Tax=Mariniphaga sp. TaxID=1954475 RepID=UPI003567E751